MLANCGQVSNKAGNREPRYGYGKKNRGKKMNQMTLKPFDDLILEGMRDPEYAVAYLQDALEDTPADFLRALGKYVKANGGIAQCSERTGISREALYRMLSATGNPE